MSHVCFVENSAISRCAAPIYIGELNENETEQFVRESLIKASDTLAIASGLKSYVCEYSKRCFNVTGGRFNLIQQYVGAIVNRDNQLVKGNNYYLYIHLCY